MSYDDVIWSFPRVPGERHPCGFHPARDRLEPSAIGQTVSCGSFELVSTPPYFEAAFPINA
jgi:hypothetical protein